MGNWKRGAAIALAMLVVTVGCSPQSLALERAGKTR